MKVRLQYHHGLAEFEDLGLFDMEQLPVEEECVEVVDVDGESRKGWVECRVFRVAQGDDHLVYDVIIVIGIGKGFRDDKPAFPSP